MSSANTSVKPTIVFVPGAHHGPEHFSPIISLLEQQSYPSVAVSLLSIGIEAETASLSEDVFAIREVLARLVEAEKKDVVLVIHSYGGVPGCQTIRGLDKETRVAEGKEGGIIHCVFLAALLVPKGETLVGAVGGGGLPPWSDRDVSLRVAQASTYRSATDCLFLRKTPCLWHSSPPFVGPSC